MGLLTLTPAQEAKRDKEFSKDFQYDAELGWIEREHVVRLAAVRSITPQPRTGHRQRREGVRSSKSSGDGNSDDPDPDPERRAQPLQLYDQSDLADLLQVSKKNLQNLYSLTPHLLPATISIPGARGPRWTQHAVQEWLSARPAHTNKPAPVTTARKVGRPRIANVQGKGGAV